MNFLYKSLENSFRFNPEYKIYYNLNEIYPLIRIFLITSIKNGDKYIDPNDFTYEYGIDVNFGLDLFLSLSKNKYFIKYYSINCDTCGEKTITKEIKDIVTCAHCDNITISDNTDPFKYVNFLFKINNEYLEDLQNDLKGQPSSKFATEEGKKSNNAKPTLSNLDEEKTKLVEELMKAAIA